MAFASNPNVMSTFLQKQAVVWTKNAKFFVNFWRKYFYNHKIGPCKRYSQHPTQSNRPQNQNLIECIANTFFGQGTKTPLPLLSLSTSKSASTGTSGIRTSGFSSFEVFSQLNGWQARIDKFNWGPMLWWQFQSILNTFELFGDFRENRSFGYLMCKKSYFSSQKRHFFVVNVFKKSKLWTKKLYIEVWPGGVCTLSSSPPHKHKHKVRMKKGE
jgi:hypothetical protein